MSSVADKLDIIEKNVMSGLKDFQRATVERISELYRGGQMRVLVSDEVGLGKTLIARGTIAQFAQLKKNEGDNLVKVVYICSNAAIADQNLNKLRITSEIQRESSSYSRLSMQHLNIFNQENDDDVLNGFIQLIPLTPDTSFRMTRGAGTVEERALMYAILRRVGALKRYSRQLDELLSNGAYRSWDDWAKRYYEYEVRKCNDKSKKTYLSYMLDITSTYLNKLQDNGVTLLDEIIEICKEVKSNRADSIVCKDLLIKLRIMFARISLEKLDPDLVIMDEFQRFKFLLNSDPNSDTGLLANKFFNSENVRMLLLSATPYKMYSTLEEIDEAQVDEHYKEFFDVMDFLNLTENERKNFKTVWNNYSVQLKELTKGLSTVIEVKREAEKAMYRHICRTERVSGFESADFIDDSDVKIPLTVSEADIKSYIQAQNLLTEIGAAYNVPVDYVKSTPYIMSFMRDYQLKKKIEKYFKDNPDDVSKMNRETFWIKKPIINRYDKLPCNNARLERVMTHVFKNNAEQLLWVPPSKPYYTPQGVYKNAENFSKTLVFSSWEMVPRMLASLLSYESERKTTGKLAKADKDKEARYFHDKRKRYPVARLNFALKDGKPRDMNLLSLLYPSRFLAECFNPVECLNNGYSLKDVEKSIAAKIKKIFKENPDVFKSQEGGSHDNRWYCLAPLMLDSLTDVDYTTNWSLGPNKLLKEVKEKKQNTLSVHLQTLEKLFYNVYIMKKERLGKMPVDLIEVLTNLAIASPAVCVYRTYKMYSQDFDCSLPSIIAERFLRRMNTPEATAIVELAAGKKSNDAHWEKLLTYCKHGNIQAMFDEYAHMITNGLDDNKNIVDSLHYMLEDSMNVRTTVYEVDSLQSFKARVNGKKGNQISLRTHFAVAFTKGDGKEKDQNRKESVRNAFNSPFRPFVLASTSIGQEGLDFHNYCRRIVHWNLPSNPIDLEQREGRINRYKCLAIRQNIAKRYGSIEFEKDIWTEMFNAAIVSEKKGNSGASDLIPFWGLTADEDMVKIERIVPMYPFSRDEIAYQRLIKILSLYRLTLGQARQEELLEYIFKNCENTDDLKELFINLSPYFKETKPSQ